ncbi:MAG: acyl-CoA dehydrogenase family protein [Acidobacteriota bacterium]|nr:acyl-CoA dehydrogenase family protein [Acidobacteriota bacterium]MDE3043910.1 acyl-CoA dehydrogenase family protein [Acidobacteriota bacterium]
MNFALPDELQSLQESVRRLAQEKIKPRAREIDLSGEYPEDIFQEFRRADLLGLCIPEEYGGSGAGILGLTIAIEEVTKYSNVLGLMLLLTRLPTGPVMIAGTEAQKLEYLPGIADGTSRAAFCLSEPGAGSDVAGMSTHVVPDPEVPGGYLLTGTKCWISGGMQADWFVVFAKSGDPKARHHNDIGGYLVRADAPGLTRPRVDRKMGVKGIDTAEIVFDAVKIAPGDVIGGGFGLAMQSLNAMRPIVAARGIGLAEGALMYATEYVKNRPAFGKTIAEFQGIQWEIAKCATEIEAARLLTYRAAWLADQGRFTKEYVPQLSMCKYYASEVAVKASGLAVQLLGAAGYMEDHPTEQYYRDARQLTIVEGTSQVQLGLIGRGVLGHDLWWD